MRHTIRLIFSFFIGNLLAVFFLALTILAGLYTYVHFKQKHTTTTPPNAFLVIQLSDIFVDAESKTRYMPFLNAEKERSVCLVHALRAIEKAQKDPKITGIFIYGDAATQNGLSTIHEICTALKEFKASKKPIIAYLAEPTFRDYYWAALADKITIHPSAWFDFKGLQTEILYLGDALKQYGVGVQVIKVGKYKSMAEIFTQNKMSEANKEQLSSLITDLWQTMVTEIEQYRQLAGLNLVLEKGLLKPQEALELGLVDSVGYLDETLEYLCTLGERNKTTHTFNQIHIADYADKVRLKNERTLESEKAKIALLYVQGVITEGEASENEAGCERIARSISSIRNDSSVKAVVVRIQSPGGSAYVSERIQRELSLLKQNKPLVVSMGRVAASGGYWIATEADAIFTTPYTITGSIGAFSLLFNLQQIANDHGFTWDCVKIGRFADLESVSRPKTPEELDLTQQFMNNIYETFIHKVAKARNLSLNEVEAMAQGRVWSGSQAHAKQLVTHLGSLSDALKHAAQLGKLGNDFSFQEMSGEKTFSEITAEWLKNKPTYPVTQLRPLSRLLKGCEQQLSLLNHLNDPHSVYTLLPVDLNL
jgi:protease-4